MSTNEQAGRRLGITPSNAAQFVDRVLVRLFQMSPLALLLLMASDFFRGNSEMLVIVALAGAALLAVYDIA